MEPIEPLDTDKPVLTFQGVLGYEMVEEDTEHGPVFKIFKGSKKKRLWAMFVDDKAGAINSMYLAYSSAMERVLREAQNRIKDPDKAAEAIEAKNKDKVSTPEEVPVFAKKKNIVE